MRKLECRREALFQYRGLPPVGMAVSMALQHLVAMIQPSSLPTWPDWRMTSGSC